MVSTVERIMSRRQVDAEIKADPVMIVLTRQEKVSDGAGGWRLSEPRDLDPQEVAIVPAKRRLSDMLVNTELGDVVNAPFIVLGRYNLDIERGDHFTWNGDDFKVDQVGIKEEVSKTCPVIYFGGTNNA